MLTGDLCVGHLQHLCIVNPDGQRHCADRDDAVSTTSQALLQVFFTAMATLLPAANRWHTYEDAQVKQGGVAACHSIGPRAFTRAFAPDSDVVADPESWEAMQTGTIKTALDCWDDEMSAMRTLGCLLVTEPIDRLGALVEHNELTNGELATTDFVSANGPIARAQTELFRLVTEQDPQQLDVSTLVRHFRHSENLNQLVDECRAAWGFDQRTSLEPIRMRLLLGPIDPFSPG